MNMVVVSYYTLLLSTSRCSASNDQCQEIKTQENDFIKVGDPSLLTFSFNAESFDDFVFNFDHETFNSQSCESENKELVSARNAFYNIFCMLFQCSEWLKGSDFFEQLNQVLCDNLDNFTTRITEELNLQDSKDSESDYSEQFIKELIDNILDENHLSDKYISYEERNGRINVTFINKPIASTISRNQKMPSQSISPVSDISEPENTTTLARLPILSGKLFKKKSSVSKCEEYGLLMARILFGMAGSPLDQILNDSLNELINVLKDKKRMKKYRNQLSDFGKNLKNPTECLEKLEELLRTALKDTSKIKFRGGSLSELTIDAIVQRCLDLLKH